MASIPPPVRAIVSALAVAAVGLVGGTVLVFGALAIGGAAGLPLTPLSFLVASLVLVQGVAFGGVAVLYLRRRAVGLPYLGVRVPTLRELAVVIAGYVAALGAALTGALLVSELGVEAGTNQAAELAFEDPEVLLLLIPASFLLIGPGEELLFRGVVQNRIRESLAPAPGIALASLIFAAIHFVALSGGAGARLVSIGILFFPSVVFGTAYELTDNLVVPALVHGAYNATLFTLLYFAIRFAELQPPSGLVGV